MPYFFFEIERRKSQIILVSFLMLLAFYSASFIVIWLCIKLGVFIFLFSNGYTSVFKNFLPNFKEIFITMLFSITFGLVHWTYSQSNIIDKILLRLGSSRINPQDKYHAVLENVIEEASVSCGNINFEAFVIPVSALNAFSLNDFNGRKIIGITEGLLAKLNRTQLEAVIAHEAAHILSGDCLDTTFTVAMSEFYASILEGIKATVLVTSNEEGKVSDDAGLLLIPLIPVYIGVRLLNFLSLLLNLLISRQREYRADAVAVRLTRNPLGLAEALYVISRGWKGEGANWDRISSIFIANPRYNKIDESEGIIADMFSTHPPIKKRIDVLLSMAGLDEKALGETLGQSGAGLFAKTEQALAEYKWKFFDPQSGWTKPLSIEEIGPLDFLKPDTWAANSKGETKFAYDFEELRPIFKTSLVQSGFLCPDCRRDLSKVDYEGRQVLRCLSCQGTLVNRKDLVRILLRQEYIFPEKIKALAEAALRDTKSFFAKGRTIKTENLISCPCCKNRKGMQRMFFSWIADAEVEVSDYMPPIINLIVDKCIWCDLVWLGKDKLETLQCIYDKYKAPPKTS